MRSDSFVNRLWARLGQRGRNLGWSFAGQVLPMVAGLVFVPLLIRSLGTARFGFLSLVWVLIGYFSLFDLGLSRALTQRVADLLAKDDHVRLRAAVKTGMTLIVALALLSVPLMFAAHGVILGDLIHSGAGLAAEAEAAFGWLAFGVPIVIVSAGFRGILEGQHRFAAVNLVRTPAGIMMFAGPWLATQVSPTLPAVTAAVLVVRLGQTVGFAVLARSLLGGLVSSAGFDRTEVRLLFGFGLWMTVSNIVSPLLVYLDRFVISHFGNLSDVAYYSTPFDLISRMLFVNNSVAAVSFPALAAANARNRAGIARIWRQHFAIVFVLMAPVMLIVFLFAKALLTLWIGAALAAKSAPILRILAVGMLVNSLTSASFTVIQAMRRADLTAKVHLIELPLYLGLLIVVVQRYGITGAAFAWLFRVTLDFVLLTVMAWRLQQRAVARDQSLAGAALQA